jgi:ER membrane protein complex subunit 1
MCGIYVVDSMKGTLVYHAEVGSSLRGCEIKTALTENWLVYHYYETAGSAKGYRMVSVEFYEGQKEDEKTKRYVFYPFFFYLINFYL